MIVQLSLQPKMIWVNIFATKQVFLFLITPSQKVIAPVHVSPWFSSLFYCTVNYWIYYWILHYTWWRALCYSYCLYHLTIMLEKNAYLARLSITDYKIILLDNLCGEILSLAVTLTQTVTSWNTSRDKLKPGPEKLFPMSDDINHPQWPLSCTYIQDMQITDQKILVVCTKF